MPSLRERAAAPELMDDAQAGGAELRKAFRHLRLLNRLFGAASPVLYGVKRLWREAGKPRQLTILDVGAGSGDINRLLLKWADTNGITIRIILADISEEACAEARLLFCREPRVEVRRSDLHDLPGDVADITTGSQFVHHYAADRLPDVVRSMLVRSRIGAVICDIHRHLIPWTAVWVTTRLISNNRYIRNDGPLSVAKGFRSHDWEQLGEALHLPDLHYSWRPLFRYAVVIRKPGG